MDFSRTQSVLVRWNGPCPFNDTTDAHTNLTEKEARQVAVILSHHRYSHTVDIVKPDGEEFIFERVE